VDVEPSIGPSARRHGIADEDMLHAYRNMTSYQVLEDSLVMVIGADRAGNLLEIGVESKRGRRIVHAMKARRKHLR
jgi:hypothetical protein